MIVARPASSFRKTRRVAVPAALTVVATLSTIGSLRAGTQELPRWDVDGTCRRQIGPAAEDLRNRINLNQCIESEQSSYEFLKDSWTLSSDAIQARCLSLQQAGPIRKYAALATCVAALSLSNGEDQVPPARFRP